MRQAWLFAGLTITCWSTVATAFKLTLQHTDFFALVCWASWMSSLVLWALVFLSKRHNALKSWRTSDWARSAWLGALNPAAYYLLLFKAYELLPAQQAQVLNFVWPVMLVLLSALFFGEKVRRWSWLALAVSFIGVAVIATRGDLLAANWASLNPLGVIVALASSLFWAAYWLANRADQRDPLLRLAVNFSFGSVWMVTLFVLFALLGERPLSSLLLVTPAALGAAYIALFEMSLAFYFWLRALNAAPNTAGLSHAIFITPFLSLLVISQVLGERIVPSTLIGLVLILIGILLHRFTTRNK